MKKENIWFITAKTNLHVGNENMSSYGLIDLAVQRNVTTGLPCINSSSLKGALNEFASQFDDLNRIDIFGSDKKDSSKESKKGKYVFFDANILFLPVQDDNNLYHLETSHDVLDRFRDQMSLFNINLNEKNNELIEELIHVLKIQKEVKCCDNNAAFIELCSDDNLPIIARNYLENGESKNLWYEQVVPAETVFYTFIDDGGDDSLTGEIGKEKAIVQIGANATIGYGYCKFTKFNSNKHE